MTHKPTYNLVLCKRHFLMNFNIHVIIMLLTLTCFLNLQCVTYASFVEVGYFRELCKKYTTECIKLISYLCLCKMVHKYIAENKPTKRFSTKCGVELCINTSSFYTISSQFSKQTRFSAILSPSATPETLIYIHTKFTKLVSRLRSCFLPCR